MNDLSRSTCPAEQVKCVVIDEAHKALGNHAYCQVIKTFFLKKLLLLFRFYLFLSIMVFPYFATSNAHGSQLETRKLQVCFPVIPICCGVLP